jgi:predicted nucleic acid-binding protein
VSWLSQQREIGVATAVWLEIVEGTPDRRAEAIALRLLYRFERVDVTAGDIDWAIRQMLRFHLSHGLDAMDCLIASVSYRLNSTLYTRNLRHFTPMLGGLAQRPY